jgi:hypothetical protein
MIAKLLDKALQNAMASSAEYVSESASEASALFAVIAHPIHVHTTKP